MRCTSNHKRAQGVIIDDLFGMYLLCVYKPDKARMNPIFCDLQNPICYFKSGISVYDVWTSIDTWWLHILPRLLRISKWRQRTSMTLIPTITGPDWDTNNKLYAWHITEKEGGFSWLDPLDILWGVWERGPVPGVWGGQRGAVRGQWYRGRSLV